jgi:hypothetical protein
MDSSVVSLHPAWHLDAKIEVSVNKEAMLVKAGIGHRLNELAFMQETLSAS